MGFDDLDGLPDETLKTLVELAHRYLLSYPHLDLELGSMSLKEASKSPKLASASCRLEQPHTNLPEGWRARFYRFSTRLYHANPATSWLTWIENERIAIGTLPTAATILNLRAEGVTHVINCRARVETLLSQDLGIERALFGRLHVSHAPMWDTGCHQHPRRWSDAARFAARALDEDATSRVFIHCKAGSHRSVLVAYAALRLRNHSADNAANLITSHRVEAELLPAYRASVDDWIGNTALRN